MWRADQTLIVTATAILAACASSLSSTTDGARGGSQAEPGPLGAQPRPPQTELTEEVQVPGSAPIDADKAKAALGDPRVRGKLRALALQAASNAGVANPTKIYAVAAADHQVAEALLSGAMIDDHAPVYVIVATGGRFTATRQPPNGNPPQGTTLTVTVDAATFRVTDFGIVDVPPELSKLDPMIVDLSSP